jgi:Na+/proline symporter
MIDYIVIVVYLLLMIAVGLVFRRFNSNDADYFKSGCKGSWWLVGGSIFMSAFSAWTFTGAAGLAFEAGWTVSTIYLANTLCLFVNFLFLGAWFRQLRVTTTPEVIALRFGIKTKDFYAWIGVFMSIIYSALFLYGLSIFSSAVLGFNIQQTIIVLGVIVIFYCAVGGSWGVMATDFLQTLVLLPMTIVLAGVALWKLGGIDGMFLRIDEMGLTEDYALVKSPGVFAHSQFTIVWIMALVVKNASANLSLSSAVRFFGVKDGREAKKASLLACVLMALGAIIWIIPPIACRLLFADQVALIDLAKPAEAAYAIASVNLLPAGMSALMVVAMFTATMSSMDTGINRNAAIIVKDILPRVLPSFRKKTPTELLRFSMIVSAVLGILIILLALYFSFADSKGIFDYMLNLGAMLNLPMAVPMILGLFIKRAPGWSAIFSVLCTFTVAICIHVNGGVLNFQEKIFINLFVGSTAFLATVPFWSKSSDEHKEKVRSFYERMHTPVDFKAEVGEGNDARQLITLGTFATVMGGFVCLLLLIPNPLSGRLMILFVAGFMLGVGQLMVFLGRRTRTKDEADITAD